VPHVGSFLGRFQFRDAFLGVAYALVPLFAYVWFGEKVLPARWVAIGLIVVGVFLVSRTPPSTTHSWADEQRVER
jgi:drug/metabolite transporter (DMT)-like permease